MVAVGVAVRSDQIGDLDARYLLALAVGGADVQQRQFVALPQRGRHVDLYRHHLDGHLAAEVVVEGSDLVGEGCGGDLFGGHGSFRSLFWLLRAVRLNAGRQNTVRSDV